MARLRRDEVGSAASDYCEGNELQRQHVLEHADAHLDHGRADIAVVRGKTCPNTSRGQHRPTWTTHMIDRGSHLMACF